MMETSISRGLPRAMVDDVFSAPVHINAGGTLYTTTLDTLTRYPESKLAKLFDGTLPIPIDPINRQYFLDIDGSVFTHLLNFLRYGELLLPEDFTQLPLLTKLADHFQIQDMVQVLMNFESEEKPGIEEENISKKQKKSRRNRNSFRKNKSHSGSNENLNQSLEPEKKDNVAETDNMKIGTCELGIVKLGVLQGPKVDFGTMESATMKSQMLESQMLATKETHSEKIVASYIESEALVAKSSKVEVLETGQMKCNTVEMNKVKTGNIEMETIDAGLIKVEMLENNMLKTETVEVGAVSAASVEVKSLESETLKLKTLEVDTLTANICTLVNKQESMNLGSDNNTSDVVIIKVYDKQHLCFFTTDNKIIGNIYDLKIGTLRNPQYYCYCDKLSEGHSYGDCRGLRDEDEEFLYDYDTLRDPRSFNLYYHCFVYSVSYGNLYYGRPDGCGTRASQTCCQTGLMNVFQSLLKNGYKLSSSWIKDDNDGEREYVFCK